MLIQQQATDDGLRSSVSGASQGANLLVERDRISQPAVYDAFQRQTATRVRGRLGDAVTAGAQFSRSSTVTVRTIDSVLQGPPVTWNPSVVSYAGIRDHVHLVAGRWPADTRAGNDWPLTVSARATDDLGTPLDIKVGSEYCFNYLATVTVGPFRGHPPPEIWCGRIAATWLPNDVNDAYWAGHVPETDVSAGHDSFFQILAQMPDAMGSAEQQYVPRTDRISGADTGRIVAGVNDLRGYYSVSSNDVFVSGLDTTIAGFLSRQRAAAGPTLVTAFGLLVVALAAMGFAALQFIQGHAPLAALWRARGWSRARVAALHTVQFAILLVLAVPVAVIAAALIVSAVATSASVGAGLGRQRLAGAAVPTLVAAGIFLVILGTLAAIRSGPELAQRRPARSGTQRRGWRRRALDLVLAAVGLAILGFVRLGGADPTSGNGQTSVVVLALPVLAVGLLAFASLRLVGVAARALTITRSLGGRLARWQVERDPAQYSRLCLLVTLATAVGIFASTYVASDRASALDRADYQVGADVRGVFPSAASPPALDQVSTTLPAGVRSAQVFRATGRPGRSGIDATILGIQGQGFWDVAYRRSDFAAAPLPSLTSQMDASDPDGLLVAGTPRTLSVSVYSSGVDARLEAQLTDAGGRVAVLSLGTLGTVGWSDLSASLTTAQARIVYPVRLRGLRIVPTGARTGGDVALQDLRTDSGAVIERFATSDGWWQEAFAPDPAAAAVVPSALHSRNGRPSANVPIDLQEIRLAPPPSRRPLPVLLASRTMADLGLSIGQSFPLHIDTVDVQLVPVATFDEFPTYYPQRESLVVVPMTSFLGRLGNAGATGPWPNELWSSSGGNPTAVAEKFAADSNLRQTFLRADVEAQAVADPLRLGLRDELGLGFIVALAVVVIGFALHFLAAARGRTTQFAIMRANGVPQSLIRRSIVAEQLVVLITALAAGTAIGLALAWAVLPIFHLGTLAEDLTPASVVRLDPVTLVAVVVGTGAISLVVGRLVAATGSRVDVMATIRSLA
ncbi:MAG: hypothetical protein JF887_03840 [Candidatus Dormibacteraeota bacterium]|uniref:ABC3 transporter permease C-terminal domain-containing protein n=1 Tax=Candidatus Amunia macphersoniae TaxID=3127014 RepID=A0A934KMJ8_9BACT|nr:hypothetical protein [Candidatus Dormibacteraeota bacterium]